mmetsp:Transcript_47734/g.153031  ORF Transcript_47734/g.153031 Transcript_47734/m.153031 type:complete len:220 (-) Transcript_47734:501-1160(-)
MPGTGSRSHGEMSLTWRNTPPSGVVGPTALHAASIGSASGCRCAPPRYTCGPGIPCTSPGAAPRAGKDAIAARSTWPGSIVMAAAAACGGCRTSPPCPGERVSSTGSMGTRVDPLVVVPERAPSGVCGRRAGSPVAGVRGGEGGAGATGGEPGTGSPPPRAPSAGGAAGSRAGGGAAAGLEAASLPGGVVTPSPSSTLPSPRSSGAMSTSESSPTPTSP